MKRFNQSDVFLLLICFVLMISAGLVNQSFKRPNITITKQDSAVNFNNYFLLFFSAGNNRMLADLFWVSTLIESDIDHYKQKDLNSWMYLRFKTINALDPKYLRAYQFGGKYLSIVKDDLLGAEKIFDAGLKLYPTDYDLNFNAGFLQAFELNNPTKAITHYEKILDHPSSPRFLPTLINKLKYEENKDLNLAFKINMELLKNTQDEHMQKKIKKDLYAIKAEMDLDCLNQKKENCNLRDFNGSDYIYVNGKYEAKEKFLKYQLHLRGED